MSDRDVLFASLPMAIKQTIAMEARKAIPKFSFFDQITPNYSGFLRSTHQMIFGYDF